MCVTLLSVLSPSLSRSSGRSNWQAMDLSDPNNLRKYYINVCRPLNAVQGCDRQASVCQIKYQHQHVSVRAVGYPVGRVLHTRMCVKYCLGHGTSISQFLTIAH